MLGVIIALIASLAWARSSILLKYLSSRINAISINTMRLWVGSIVLLALVFLSGRGNDIVQTHLLPILILAFSGILARNLVLVATAGILTYVIGSSPC